MAHILNIETSTTNCSVSLAGEGNTIALKAQNDARYSHAENLHFFIKEVLREANLSPEALQAVAVSKGPGSYTGLRIGVSAAKGLCFSLDIPLLSIPTLQALALQSSVEKGYIVPLLDARRMEVYSAVFNTQYEQIRNTRAEIISAQSFREYLEEDTVYFLGPGAEKCKSVITHRNARFQEAITYPSAAEMSRLSYHKFINNEVEDVAYFEPYYLKDFVAGK